MKKRVTAVVIAALLIALITFGVMKAMAHPLWKIWRAACNYGRAGSVRSEVSVEYEGSVTVSVFGASVEAPFMIGTDLDAETVAEPAASHIDGTMSASLYGMSTETPLECYVREEEGGNASYISADGEHWVKQITKDSGEEESAEEARFVTEIKLGLLLLNKYRNKEIAAEQAGETETIGGQQACRIRVRINGQTLQQMLEAASAGNARLKLPEGLDLSGIEGEADLYVYEKTRHPARIVIDSAPLGNTVIHSLIEAQDYVGATDKFTVSVTFTEYNTIDRIEIPEEVVSGAIESGEDLIESLIPGL